MKKLFLSLFTVMAAFSMGAVVQFTYPYEGSELTYEIWNTVTNPKKVQVVSGEGVTDLVIPDTVVYNDEKYIVTNIVASAFDGNKTITSLECCQRLVSIGDFAFRGCPNLETVVFPDEFDEIGTWSFGNCPKLQTINKINVLRIGTSAFNGCSSLEEIDMTDDATNLGAYAFNGCSSLRRVRLSSQLKSILQSTFQGCTSLTDINIPSSVTQIQTSAFQDCTALEDVTMGEGVTIINTNAFRNCKSLQSIELPSKLGTLGQYAFMNCSALQYVELPSSITSLGKYVFGNCTALKSVTIPESITSIPEQMFSGCTALKTVIAPYTLKTIDTSAFSGCTSLEQAVIPNSVTTIGVSAFNGCTGLTKVVIPPSVTSIGSSAFKGCTNVKSAVLPPAFTMVPAQLFSGCTSLQSVYLGPDVTSINDNAFFGTGVTDVYITAQTPPAIASSSFPETTRTLHLQGDEAQAKYEEADYWKEFSGFEQMAVPTDIRIRRLSVSTNPEEDTPETYAAVVEGKAGDVIKYEAVLVGDKVEIPYLFWSSSDSSKAYVNNYGVVTLLADTGETDPVTISLQSLYTDGPTRAFSAGEDLQEDLDIPTGVEEISDSGNAAKILTGVFAVDGRYIGTTLDGVSAGVYVCQFADGNSGKVIVR